MSSLWEDAVFTGQFICHIIAISVLISVFTDISNVDIIIILCILFLLFEYVGDRFAFPVFILSLSIHSLLFDIPNCMYFYDTFFQSYCCQTEFPEGSRVMVGACTYHAHYCGAGTGIFLRVRECKILLLSGRIKGE